MRAPQAVGALAASLALASAAPVLAAADTSAALLTAKVDTAIANARSYRIAVAGPSGLSLDIRSYGADRMRIMSNAGGTESESIIIGTAMYYRSADGPWKAYPVPPVTHLRKNRLYLGAPDTQLEPLDDRTDASGSTVGAFRSIATVNGGVPGSMECIYDKATYRPRACSVTLRGLASPVEVTYAGWDDSANAVEPPPGVAPPVAGGPAAAPSAQPDRH